ncbi:hypothetical protein [Streptomyces sp. NPDC055287]
MRARPVAVGIALAALASLTIAAAPGNGDDAHHQLDTAAAASGAFHAPKLAAAAGFKSTNECVSHPTQGGMGYHYVDPANIGSLHPGRPAAVIYASDKTGKRQLVAVEYIVPDSDQNPKTTKDRPKLFGQKFDGPFSDIPGLPVHYSLHAWLWKHNPSGLFAPYNPQVKCP